MHLIIPGEHGVIRHARYQRSERITVANDVDHPLHLLAASYCRC